MNHDRRRRTFSTASIFRIASALVMLAGMGMTIYHFHLEGLKNYKESAEQLRDTEQSATTTAKPLLDENTQDFRDFFRESEAVLDKSTEIKSYELAAYWHLVKWVRDRSLNDFKAHDYASVSFQELYAHPEKYRGRPIRLKLSIRRVSSFDVENRSDDSKPEKLYELWGWPRESRGWLYVVVTPELPPGFPQGDDVETAATVYGYFFKLQGYYPQDAKPNSAPISAPLLIGRVAGTRLPAAPSPQTNLALTVLIVGASVLAIVVASWIISRGKKRGDRHKLPPNLPESPEESP